MSDPLDNAKTMQGEAMRDTIGDLLTQQPDAAVVLGGRYRIIRKLGEGGMGSVWLAEDTKLDGHEVAIKMLPIVLVANKRAVQQLRAEARLAIELSHPNIATLRAFEESEQGPFLVMDYIEGQTLEDLLAEKGTLTEDRVRELFTPLAAALDYSHGRKVIHRDIKPSNILIATDGIPYLADFGIAREMKDTMTRVTGRMTSGTLPYMSPEQLRGEAPAPAQDIYSLSATMYECLSGHPPFYRGQIEYQIVNEEPTPLESSTCFAAGVMQGLHKNPELRRYGLSLSSHSSEPEHRDSDQRVNGTPVPGWHYLHPEMRENMLQSVKSTTLMVDGEPLSVSAEQIHHLAYTSAISGTDYLRGERVFMSTLDALVFAGHRDLLNLYFEQRSTERQEVDPVRLWANGRPDDASAEIRRRLEHAADFHPIYLLLLSGGRDDTVAPDLLRRAELAALAQRHTHNLIEIVKIHKLVNGNREAGAKVLRMAEDGCDRSIFPVYELVEASLILGQEEDEISRIVSKAERCARASMYAIRIWADCAKASGLLLGDLAEAEEYLRKGETVGSGAIVCARIWPMLRSGSIETIRCLREAERAATYYFDWTNCARCWVDLLGDDSSATACMRQAEAEIRQRARSGRLVSPSDWTGCATGWVHLGSMPDARRCLEEAEKLACSATEWSSLGKHWSVLSEPTRAEACLVKSCSAESTELDNIDDEDCEEELDDPDDEETEEEETDFKEALNRRWDILRTLVIDDPHSPRGRIGDG